MIVDSLKIFVAVIEQKSFSKAAEKLFVSQPSISIQVRNLENELGIRLVHRSSKYVQLTPAGEILFPRAKKILQLYDEAQQEIERLQNVVTGNLHIGASFTIGEYILPRLTAEFVSQYPNVEIEVSIANTEDIKNTLRGHLDLGLIEAPIDDSDIEYEPFMEDEMVLVVPNTHPLAKQRHLGSLQELEEQIWILREQGSGTRAFMDHFFQDWNLKLRRSFVFGSSQGVKEAVIAGLGIALLSRFVVQKELQNKELTEVRIRGKRLLRTLYWIKLKENPLTRSMEAFIEKLKTFDAHTY